MGCCASLLRCCVRAETENPLLDGRYLGGVGDGQQQVCSRVCVQVPCLRRKTSLPRELLLQTMQRVFFLKMMTLFSAEGKGVEEEGFIKKGSSWDAALSRHTFLLLGRFRL